LEDLPKEVSEDLKFVFVDHVRQGFEVALLEPKKAVKASAGRRS
jgi:hypothetical protein